MTVPLDHHQLRAVADLIRDGKVEAVQSIAPGARLQHQRSRRARR